MKNHRKKILWAIHADLMKIAINHPGVALPINVFQAQFATKAVKLLETNADIIMSVSADAAKMEVAQNLIIVYRNVSSIQSAQLGAAPLDTAATQIYVKEGKQLETFAIKIMNAKWAIANLIINLILRKS